MAVQLVADPRTIWGFWSVRWNAYMVALYMAAGSGWLALSEAQRELLMSWLGIPPDGQSIIVALALFVGGFSSSLTIALRAIKQAQQISEQQP
jgi:hypothetical protein